MGGAGTMVPQGAEPAAREIADLRTMHVDQVGALRAPAPLREMFDRWRKGEITTDQFIAFREPAIAQMIRTQESIGMPVITDGELRRLNFQDSFYRAVSGISRPVRSQKPGENKSSRPHTRTESVDWQKWPARERLRLERNVPLEEYRASRATASVPIKVTLVNPDRVAERFDVEGSCAAYRDVDSFLTDVVSIERLMVEELVAAGCRYIQMDAPGYTAYVDDVSLAQMRSAGEDPERCLARAIAADNAVIEGFENVVFGLHICRGGARTIDPETGKVAPQWHREGHYDADSASGSSPS